MKIDADSVAVVTGAGRGIGRSLVLRLASRGAAVGCIDVDEQSLRETASRVPASAIYCCDISDAEAVRRAAKALSSELGNATLLINNAGVSVAGRVEDLNLADLEWAMKVNFWGTVHTCRAFLPQLRRSVAAGQSAAVCNVLSDFALFALPTKAAYAASKHAARAFSEALSAELREVGISVVAVYPGATATGLVAQGRAVEPEKQAAEATFLADGMDPDDVAARMVRGIERERRRVLIGWDARLVDLASRAAPSLVQAAVGRFWRRIPFL